MFEDSSEIPFEWPAGSGKGVREMGWGGERREGGMSSKEEDGEKGKGMGKIKGNRKEKAKEKENPS